MSAERILMNEFKELQQEEWVHVQVWNSHAASSVSGSWQLVFSLYQLKDDNIFRWEVALIVLNPTSLYYGGYFKVVLQYLWWAFIILTNLSCISGGTEIS